MKQRMHVWIYGLVKGVFFRKTVKEEADKLGLKGFVRNLEDSVESVFEGEKEYITKMIEFCKKGPVYAKITEVKTKEEKWQGDFKEFKVLHF